MLNIYSNLNYQTGQHIAGIWKLRIAPKEWFTYEPTEWFPNGAASVGSPIAPNTWLELNFLPDSFEFSETPKATKSGIFYQLEIAGLTNSIPFETLQLLNTLSHHEFVVILIDKSNSYRCIGNKYFGMTLEFSTKETNAAGGTKTVNILLKMDSLKPASYLD